MPTDLNTVIDDQNWTLMSAYIVTDHGDIYGLGEVNRRLEGFRLSRLE